MAVPLLLTAAVPFCLPQQEDEELVDGVELYMAIVQEAASAVQFVLGPGHRPRAEQELNTTFTVLNPEAKLMRAPPNTPNTKETFVFPDVVCVEEDEANDADHSEDSSDEKTKEENVVLENRKRRRLGSWSGSRPQLRRVPHKKATPVNIIAPPLSFANPTHNQSEDVTDSSSSSPSTSMPSSSISSEDSSVAPSTPSVGPISCGPFLLASPLTSESSTSSVNSLLTSPLASDRSTLGEHLSRLSNFQNESEKTSDDKWAELGKELRAIADKFEKTKMDKVSRKKEVSILRDSLESIMPNSVWSFIFWKLFDKFK